ncbi:MAG: hypothetical protein GXO62_05495 [Epsilonproteobacteria bacterium]|nr:hypothetical protein [Campylobacterota bacterium]
MIDFILDLLPNDDYFYLYYLAGFVVVTSALIIYFAKKFNKPKPKQAPVERPKELTLNDLIDMVSNPNASASDLYVALQLYHEKYKVHDDVGNSLTFFKKALNHKNKAKALFDFYHDVIMPANTQYKDQLDKIEREALNS